MGKNWVDMVASWEAEGNVCFGIEQKGVKVVWVVWGPRRGVYTRSHSPTESNGVKKMRYRTHKEELPFTRLKKIGKFDYAPTIASDAVTIIRATLKDWLFAWRIVRKKFNAAMDKTPIMVRHLINSLNKDSKIKDITKLLMDNPDVWHLKPTRRNVRETKIKLIRRYLDNTRIFTEAIPLPMFDGPITDAMALNIFSFMQVGKYYRQILLSRQWGEMVIPTTLLRLALLEVKAGGEYYQYEINDPLSLYVESQKLLDSVYNFCYLYHRLKNVSNLLRFKIKLLQNDAFSHYPVCADTIYQECLEANRSGNYKLGFKDTNPNMIHLRVFEENRFLLCSRTSNRIKSSVYLPTLQGVEYINLFLQKEVCPECLIVHEKLIAVEGR